MCTLNGHFEPGCRGFWPYRAFNAPSPASHMARFFFFFFNFSRFNHFLLFLSLLKQKHNSASINSLKGGFVSHHNTQDVRFLKRKRWKPLSNRNLSTILFFPLTRSRSYFCPFSSQLSKRKQQKQQKNLLSSSRLFGSFRIVQCYARNSRTIWVEPRAVKERQYDRGCCRSQPIIYNFGPERTSYLFLFQRTSSSHFPWENEILFSAVKAWKVVP